jgi:hypothetical protein
MHVGVAAQNCRGVANLPEELACIVCGMEHSGTTVFEFLLESHSLIHSAFELGILGGTLKKFEKVQPWAEWLGEASEKAHGWGLPAGYLERLKHSKSYSAAYRMIIREKGSDNGQTIVHDSKYIIDKTPSYIYDLSTILESKLSLGSCPPVSSRLQVLCIH